MCVCVIERERAYHAEGHLPRAIVCVCERERERKREIVCVCVRERDCVCLRECV